jgi:hypothetical protein
VLRFQLGGRERRGGGGVAVLKEEGKRQGGAAWEVRWLGGGSYRNEEGGN